jgi:rhodanese-related sulfurtransferase/DNA-binding transcriptional ArsR family regulator
MSTHSPKREVFAQLARVGNALASSVRLELLELLAQGERSVDRLSALTGSSVANTSQHLQKLKQAGLILGRKQGQFVYYRIAGDDVTRMLAALSRVGEAHIAEIDRIVRLYFLAKDDFEPIAAPELLDRAKKGLVTVLDVRPPEEFASGHVPGALNIPVDQLARRLRELPKGKEVIAYCRGPFCLMSFDAVHLLRKKGMRARRLQDGMPEWRMAGLPVELDSQVSD